MPARGSLGARSSAPGAEGEAFAARARAIAARPALPERSELAALVDAARAALAATPEQTRPRDSAGRPGGLVVLPKKPAVLVPDLHARPTFLAEVFSWAPSPIGASLAAHLAAGRVSLVCLGDIFHTEAGGARDRWMRAYREYASDWASREAMDEEMALALSTSRIVLEALAAFPGRFFCLKGNHENVSDEEGRGDHSFYKFAAEGEMVSSWFRITYGSDLLLAYRELELGLPLLAEGPRFLASHAEPAFALGRGDVIESRSRPAVVEALTWTPNDEAEPGSVATTLGAILGRRRASGALWFAGHRPVRDRYALRAGGLFVQFHNPDAQRVAFLLPDRDPDPERDILDVET